ncbi:hypothetical protein [Alistipes sp.]|uniref:hypothetical protein n=1 Tax=Alistipes sp. TaxID=1872444 RepID=UPI0025C30EEE|nr:hypothetical protein [Alistipes sp.]
MSTMNLSAAARHEKYLYDKKYQERYWERRAAKRQKTSKLTVREKSTDTLTHQKKISVEINIDDELKPEIGEVEVSVRRTGQTPERYTQELERANRTLASENRRLIKLLTQYQEIIRIGTNNWKSDESNK